VDPTELGETALPGWRGKVAAGIARPVSHRTGVEERKLRAAIGVLFFVLSVYYVGATARRALLRARG
jgi:hypothetical protein